jgi:HD superfamily phosphohydrolase
MSAVTFADVVHQSISFARNIPAQALVLELIDTAWVQRLRDISQTANTRLVYMFSEHSRFGHSLGVAYLACQLMDKLAATHPSDISEFGPAVAAAALLHDIGHLAPGSHTAYRTWFPSAHDEHESVGTRIIRNDKQLQETLSKVSPELPETVCKILDESEQVPPWTWEIISGGGWNVDRGNWCIVDSVLGGVSYGHYNIPAITDSIVITGSKHLALRENRLDAMMHFAVSRHALYRQMYQHRVLLAADTLNAAIAKRARCLNDKLGFCDNVMRQVLKAKSPTELELDALFGMRESWWRYHLSRWHADQDKILSDLCGRLINRDLLKTIRIGENDDVETLEAQARSSATELGFDPDYYVHKITTARVHSGDYERSMQVLMDDGRSKALTEADGLMNYLLAETSGSKRAWLAVPGEVKKSMGRPR